MLLRRVFLFSVELAPLRGSRLLLPVRRERADFPAAAESRFERNPESQLAPAPERAAFLAGIARNAFRRVAVVVL